MDQQAPDPRLGLVLQERYRIIDRVGEGAMAVVYRGERLTLGKMVAVKFLHPWVATQPQFRVRFETEARAMSRLNHPNCVSVIDFGFEGAPFVVMDFVAGRTLRSLMVEVGPLEPGRAIAIMKQILAGTGHAHAQGIVHRDIKPENMMLVAGEGLEDHVRILDFGLAKLHDGPAMTAGFAVGTPSYMSPEQTGGPGEIDGRTDIYAAGVVLFELLTGRKPFISENVAEIFLMHRESAPPSLREALPAGRFSPALEQVVGQALAKFPEERFASASAFVAALERTPEGGAARVPVPRQTESKTEFDPSLGARVLAHLAQENRRDGLVAVSESGAQIDMELQEVLENNEDAGKTIVVPTAPPPLLPSGRPGAAKAAPAAPGVKGAKGDKGDKGETKSAPVSSTVATTAAQLSPPSPSAAQNKRVAGVILSVFFLFVGLSLVAVVRNGRAGFAAARLQEQEQAKDKEKQKADKAGHPAAAEGASAPKTTATSQGESTPESAKGEAAASPSAPGANDKSKGKGKETGKDVATGGEGKAKVATVVSSDGHAQKKAKGWARPAPTKSSSHQESHFFRR